MIRALKYYVTIPVLACYLFIAVAGHVALLSTVLNSSGPSGSVTTEGKSKPIETKPIWTQRKHVLSILKIEIPSQGLVISPRPPDDERESALVSDVPIASSQLEEFHPYLPRDPTFF